MHKFLKFLSILTLVYSLKRQQAQPIKEEEEEQVVDKANTPGCKGPKVEVKILPFGGNSSDTSITGDCNCNAEIQALKEKLEQFEKLVQKLQEDSEAAATKYDEKIQKLQEEGEAAAIKYDEKIQKLQEEGEAAATKYDEKIQKIEEKTSTIDSLSTKVSSLSSTFDEKLEKLQKDSEAATTKYNSLSTTVSSLSSTLDTKIQKIQSDYSSTATTVKSLSSIKPSGVDLVYHEITNTDLVKLTNKNLAEVPKYKRQIYFSRDYKFVRVRLFVPFNGNTKNRVKLILYFDGTIIHTSFMCPDGFYMFIDVEMEGVVKNVNAGYHTITVKTASEGSRHDFPHLNKSYLEGKTPFLTYQYQVYGFY